MHEEESPQNGAAATPAVPVSGYWDLSTAYATPGDFERLEASQLVVVHRYPEGAFVSLDPDLLTEQGLDALSREGLSAAFASLVRQAIAAGVNLIRFDADGPQYASLPDAVASWDRSASTPPEGRLVDSGQEPAAPARENLGDSDDVRSRQRADAAYVMANAAIADVPAALFDVDGRLELQRCDEEATEIFTDDHALAEILRRAATGDRGALLALYLEGRPAADERFFYPAAWLPQVEPEPKKAPPRPPATPQQITKARELYQNDDCNIDDDAVLSETDDGVWVQAWVWLNAGELEDDLRA